MSLTTEQMRSVLLQMHGDDDWRKFIKHLSTRQVRELYSSANQRGQITNLKPLPVDSQLNIWDIYGIEY